MKFHFLQGETFALALALCLTWGSAFAAVAAPELLKAKRDGEARGYAFVTSHDEIVRGAQKENKLRALTSLEPAAIKAMTDAFKRKYPFIDVYVEEIAGTEDFQRFILEMKMKRSSTWDSIHLTQHFYNEYLPYLKKFDILGMAEHGVLGIPRQIIDSANRNIVAKVSNITVVAYNKALISEEKVPNSWEGFLRPEFKGKKFVTDIRPLGIAGLVPAWGVEKTLDFARKLAGQEPIWTRGGARVLNSLAAGEHSLVVAVNFGAVKRAETKDPMGRLAYKVVEPVPVRFAGTDGILAAAEHPNAALLWLEFQTSVEGQRIIDQYWPYGASVFVPGSAQEKVVAGKRLSLMSWDLQNDMDAWVEKVIEAYGFPKEEKQK